MKDLSVETEDPSSSLLEFAANNDVESFKRSLELDLSPVDEPGLWYVRKEGTRHITQEERTPLMVASTYGAVDVLELIVALPEVDLNKACGPHQWTALHCAASGGSVHACTVVKLLLSAGADPNMRDSLGRRPTDVISSPPPTPSGAAKAVLESLLTSTSDGSSPDFAPSGEAPASPLPERKQYPADPSLPDIRNSIYASDEFRMFSFKIRPCSRAYSHDWTECPFVHPGENARRRDPRKFHYSCVPCPDFRRGGACRRGDMCEYGHGVFECWLHPAQYRTRLCKDGTGCNRQVCFFAHTHEELRPLYVSTGSGVPSPRSVSSSSGGGGGGFMDMASALSLFPGSPTSQNGLMAHAFDRTGPISSPTAAAANGISSSPSWAQLNVPALTRLRSSINARDLSSLSKASNLEELFAAEVAAASSSSPRFVDPTCFSPTHKSAVRNNIFQQQQAVLSPINTGIFSPRNIESPSPSLLSRMSPRNLEVAHARSLSSRDLGFERVSSDWSDWGSPTGKADWSVGGDDRSRLKTLTSPWEPNKDKVGGGRDEPDLSWVNALVKESSSPPPPTEEMVRDHVAPVSTSGSVASGGGDCLKQNPATGDAIDHAVLGAWLEQMQLDQLVV